MTTQEFSNTFDTLLNSYNTQAMFGEASSKADIVLDEYEKSVLLTQAQDIIVKSYFNRNNATGEGFDDSARRLMDFSELITIAELKNQGEALDGSLNINLGDTYDERGILFKMPTDILLILNEKISTDLGVQVVVPINYKEYDRNMSKAYTLPLKKLAWRLFLNVEAFDLLAEIIPTEGIKVNKYKIRYIRRPKPIVLTDLLADNLDIDGVSNISECELNPIIHMDILNKAVELALTTRGRMAPQENK